MAESHSQSFEELWRIIKQKTGFDLPRYLQTALKYTGFDGLDSIKLITNEEIDFIESFIKNNIKTFIKRGENLFDYYHIFHDKVDQFKIVRGHRIKLLEIAKFVNEKMSTEGGAHFFVKSNKRQNNDQPETVSSNSDTTELLILDASKCDELTKRICNWMKTNAAQLYSKFSDGFSSEMIEVNIKITCPICKLKIRTNSKLSKFKSHMEHDHATSSLPAPPLPKLRKLDNNKEVYMKTQTVSSENAVSTRTPLIIDPGMAEDESRSEATFKYKVENVSKLKDNVFSPQFFVRNLPWQIMIMPRIMPSKDDNRRANPSLGFFLQCNSESKSSSWSCNATAELRLLSFKQDQNPFIRKIKHLFCNKHTGWGFSSFKCWNEVVDPDNGYIQHDCIVLEVYVVSQEPKDIFGDSKEQMEPSLKPHDLLGNSKGNSQKKMEATFVDKTKPKYVAPSLEPHDVLGDSQKQMEVTFVDETKQIDVVPSLKPPDLLGDSQKQMEVTFVDKTKPKYFPPNLESHDVLMNSKKQMEATFVDKANPIDVVSSLEPPDLLGDSQKQMEATFVDERNRETNLLIATPLDELGDSKKQIEVTLVDNTKKLTLKLRDVLGDSKKQMEVKFVDKTNPSDLGFTLKLSVDMTYDQMASAVGHKINADPNEIQFFKCQKSKNLPGPLVDSSINISIKDLLFHKSSTKMFYQRLTTNNAKCENKNQIKCLWLSMNMKEQRVLTLHTKKNGTVKTLLDEAIKQIELNPEKGSGQLRILEVYGHVLLPGPSEDDSMDNLTNEKEYRIEEIPRDEINLLGDELLVPVSHYCQVVYNNFGIPFYVKIKQGERFIDVKKRLQKKLGVSDEKWQKYQFAKVSMGRADYIADYDVMNLADFKSSPKKTRLALRPFLGLEHSETNSEN